MKRLLYILCVSLTSSFLNAQYFELSTPKRLGTGINSSAEESAPVLSPDGKEMYFVRTFDEYNVGGINDQDIWVSTKNEKGVWQEANNSTELNTREHNGLTSFSEDGTKVYVLFSNGIKSENKGIGLSVKNATGVWGKPTKIEIPSFTVVGENIGFTVSNDGKVLILSLAGDNSKGEEDLYYSLNTNGVWSTPKHLGDVINSAGYEISPFLSKGNDTLYFASNGFGGQGGCDIFYTVKQGDWNDWTVPTNMGNKINSPGFDAYLVKYGTQYYWSSNRNATDADIYFADEMRPPKLEIQETHTNVTAFGGNDGAIDVVVKSGVAPYKYAWSNGQNTEDLALLKRGFYQITVTDAIGQTQSLPVEITEPVPVVQKVIRLPEVRYAVNSWEFINDTTIQSFDSLNKVAQLLIEYPGMMLELISHTDSRGDNNKNLALSINRAKAVYKYLVEQKGIDARRLIPVGKGEMEPARVLDSETNSFIELTEAYITPFKTTDKAKFERLHQANRRTEGKIIGLNFDPSTAPEAPKDYLIFKPK